MIEVGGRQLIVFVWHLRWCHLVSSGDHVKLPLLRGVIKIQFTKYKIQNADSVLWSTAAQHPLSRVCDQNAIVDVQVSSGRKQQQQRPLFDPSLFNISIINITVKIILTKQLSSWSSAVVKAIMVTTDLYQSNQGRPPGRGWCLWSWRQYQICPPPPFTFETLVTGMAQATELIHTIIIFISSLWLLEARIIHLKIGTYDQHRYDRHRTCCLIVDVTSGVDLASYRSHLGDGISLASAFMGRPLPHHPYCWHPQQ